MARIGLRHVMASLGIAVVLLDIAGSLFLVKVHQQHAAASPTLASGYMYAGHSAAGYLRFTSDGHGHVSGLWYTADKIGSLVVPAHGTFSGTIAGTIAGTQLTLVFSQPSSGTYLGRLSAEGKTITLQGQDTSGLITTREYRVATIQQYNQAVVALEGRATAQP